jgi:hypothetical protein
MRLRTGRQKSSISSRTRSAYGGQPTLAAFIIKGRSSPTVRAEQVAHQILRLARLDGLGLAVLATTGNVLDDVREHLLTMAKSIGCRYAFADVVDLARIFVAYGLICPRDGRKTAAGRCTCGYQYSRDQLNVFQREALQDLARTRERGKPAGVIVLRLMVAAANRSERRRQRTAGGAERRPTVRCSSSSRWRSYALLA